MVVKNFKLMLRRCVVEGRGGVWAWRGGGCRGYVVG